MARGQAGTSATGLACAAAANAAFLMASIFLAWGGCCS